MSYYLDLFSPSTYDAFLRSDKSISGFRSRQYIAAVKVQPGDILICYLTKQSSWVAALRVTSPLFEDNTARFTTVEDPFVLRFRVEPLVLLNPDHGTTALVMYYRPSRPLQNTPESFGKYRLIIDHQT